MNGGKTEQRDATLTDVHNILKELLKWTKFAGIKEVKPVLESKLDTDIKKIIYVLSDGNRGTREISKIVGTISHASIANYWQDWEKSGLGESSQTMGGGSRFKCSFDLNDFGIKVPEIPKSAEKVEQPQTMSESQITNQPKTEIETNGN
jgi:hypothetical protein